MQKIVVLLIAIITLAACSQKETSPGVTINTTNIDDAKITVSYTSIDSVLATSQLVDGKAQVDFTLEYPQLIAIEIEGVETPVIFFADLTAMTVDIDGSHTPPTFKISGSSYNDSLEAFSAKQTANEGFMRTMYPMYEQAMKANDSLTIFVINTRADSAYNAFNQYTKDFAAKNGMVGMMIAMRYMYTAEYGDLLPIYDGIPVKYRNAPEVVQFKSRMDVLENTQIGKRFTDFTQRDTLGADLSIGSISGEYILVDFWASWCAPCRRANPDLVKVYADFHEKGFEIVGVSLDEDAAAWRKAIVDDNLIWPQMSDLKGWKNEGAAAYAIRSIPQSVLLDNQGFIVHKNLDPEKLRTFLEDNL